MAELFVCEKCRLAEPNDVCPICGETMQCYTLTQKLYEKILYGGLTKKKHDHMMAKANELNAAFRKFMQTHEGSEKEKLVLWRLEQQSVGVYPKRPPKKRYEKEMSK